MTSRNEWAGVFERVNTWLEAFKCAIVSVLAVLVFVACLGASAQAQTAEQVESSFAAGPNIFRLDASPALTGAVDELTWSLIDRPAGSTAILDDATGPVASFVADIDGAYRLELLVSTGGQASILGPIEVSTLNQVPVAHIDAIAGVVPAAVGAPIALSATGSFDGDGDRLTYSWTLALAPQGATTTLSADGPFASLTPDVEGAYAVSLTVSDPAGAVSSHELVVETGLGVVSPRLSVSPASAADGRVLVDAFASTSVPGAVLFPSSELIYVPQGSAAALVDGDTLDPVEPGRLAITPDQPGEYVIRANIQGDSGLGTTTAIVYSGQQANVPPLANAGADQQFVPGNAVDLDGTASSDVNGDVLSYRWSLVHAPQGSFATIEGTNAPRAMLLPDVPGDYVVQLAVSDQQAVDYSTVVISSTRAPLVVSAGADQVFGGQGSVPLDGSLAGSAINTAWSLLGLTGTNVSDAVSIDDPLALSTLAQFSGLPSSGESAAQPLQDFGLIIFNDANIRSQVQGRTFIGNNLTGQSADFATRLQGANGTDVLIVGNNIDGNPKNVNNGGDVRYGNQANARINLNGGGSLVRDPSISIAPLRSSLEAFSQSLAQQTVTSAVDLGGRNVLFSATPGPDGVAVFDVPDGNQLFNNNQRDTIDIALNGAEAVVINVGGANIQFHHGNFVGASNNPQIRSKVIWNFHQADVLEIWRHLPGSVLAPNAAVRNQSPIRGSLVAKSIEQRAAIELPGFEAAGAFGGQPEPVAAAVFQLAASNGQVTAADTILITTGNAAPAANITASEAQPARGSTVTFSAAGSSDANGDALTYQWALLSKPEGSTAALAPSADNALLAVDMRGYYVVQLIANDGQLASEPVTAFVEVLNSSPVITSTPPAGGTQFEAVVYQAAAEDTDNDTLTWSLVSGPQGLSIDPASGLVEWAPQDAGTFDVTIRVEDTAGGFDEQDFQLIIDPVIANVAPTIDPIQDVSLRPGETIAFTVTATDGDGGVISFLGTNLPDGALLDGATGLFSYTADANAPASYPVTITVTDGMLTASTAFTIAVTPWPDTDPTLLSGTVLDAQDFANGVTTPVVGATITVDGIIVTTDAGGAFSFATLDLANVGNRVLSVDGSSADPAGNGDLYGSTSRAITIFANSPNVLGEPILLDRFGGSEIVITEITDDLPAGLRSCRIQRASNASGTPIDLTALNLTASEPLAAGTEMVIWSKTSDGADYDRIGTATVAADGTTLEGVTGTLASGASYLVTPVPLAGEQSPLQSRTSYVPSVLGEGNMQMVMEVPPYISLGQSRSASLIYNSRTADPRPIITADITIPAEAALTATLEAELYVDGQRVPGVTVTDLTQAQNGTSAPPSESETATVSLSVTYDASAFATGAYDYELYVFAGHTCSAAAAKVEGRTFVNNRSSTPYGPGWKPTDIQTVIQQPDGTVVIEEPDGTLSLYDDGGIADPYVEGFDQGFGDWGINGDGRSITFEPAGGNPGGHLVGVDRPVGDIWYFVAPAALVEELRGYLDGQISYDLFQNLTSRQFKSRDIVIRGVDADGEQLSVAFDFDFIPQTTWTNFSTSLDGVGWNVIDAGVEILRAATRAEFEQALATAVSLEIRGEYRVGNDSAGLDNVQFLGRDAIGLALVFETPEGRFDSFTRNEDGTFERRYKDGTQVFFNAMGQQTAVVDPNGNRTEYAYDAEGRLSAITDPTGLVTTYTYNAAGLLSSISDPDGRVTLYGYNADGQLVSIRYPDGTFTEFESDPDGKIISATDQRGQTTTYDYDETDRLTGVTTPDGGTVSMQIGKTLGLTAFGVDLGAPTNAAFVAPEDRVTALEDARGNAAEHEVNEWGAIVRTRDPIGRETFYDRNEDNLVTRITAPSDVTGAGTLVTELAYDDNGNTTLRRDAAGTPLERQMTYEYEPVRSRVTRMVDAEGFETLYDYGDSGNLLTQTNPDGSTVIHTYDDRGLRLTTTDERGHVMGYAYDALGRLDVMTDPQNVERRMALDGRGNAVSTIDAFNTPEQQTVAQTFDEMNRVLAMVNGENEQTDYTYDDAGNPLTTTDATGIVAGRAYDDKGRVDLIDDPASGATQTTYDLTDNLTSVTAADGTTTTIAYDAVNRVTETVDALGITRRVAYDSRDNVIAITDGRGNTTTFTYDALDRVIARTNPVGDTWQFEYDARDLRTATIKPDGTRIAFGYDDRQRLISAGVVGDAITQRNYGYDDADNLVSAVSATGTPQEIAHAFTYDNRDQLTEASTATGPLGGAFSLTYEYDALGRRIAMRDSAGGVTTYLYDDADRLTSMVLPSGQPVALGYDDAGRRTAITHANGLSTALSFDTPGQAGGATGRLATIAHAGGTGSGTQLGARLGTFSFGYDVKGNITGIAEDGAVARARDYALDAIERLTGVADPASGIALESYTLDEEGNRVTSHLAAFHVTDPANRLVEDETHAFEYDVNGNLVRKTVKASGLTWRYGYSVYDELTRVSRHDTADPAAPATLTRSYTFDALGRRHTERTLDATATPTGGITWRYDGEHIAHQETLDGASQVIATRWYSHSDLTDDLVALTQNVGTGGTVSPTATTAGPLAPSDAGAHYHTDHQGSVRALTDDSGTIVNEYSYTAYGAEETAVEAIAQPFRYTGREYDAATGLYRYRARAYDPATGRFLQEDPIWFSAGDLNVHRYVWNNPVNWTDPSGLSVAVEQAFLNGISVNGLLGGRIAGGEDFATGENTARFLEQEGNNALSGISGAINCALFTLADLFNQTTAGDSVTNANSRCGVDVEEPIEVAIKDDIKLFQDALKLACRERGIVYTRELRRRFHDRITGQGIVSFSEMLDEARCFLDEGGN